MRKVLLLVMGILLVASCKNDKKAALEDFVFIGKVSNIPDGTKVYITEYGDQNAPISIDTLTIEKGEFVYQFPERDYQTINSVKADRSNGLIYFINDGEPLQLNIHRDEGGFLANDTDLIGGESNLVFFDYLAFLNDIEERAYRIPVEYSRKDVSDPRVLEAQEKEEQDLFDERVAFQVKTVRQHPTTLTSAFVIADIISSRGLSREATFELYNLLSDDIKDTYIGRLLKDELTPPAIIEVGEKVPNFASLTPEGEILSLEEVLEKEGKFTLIEFWASWCPDCQMELPVLVDIYREYHSKGLNILGVSIDNKREEWVNLINEYNMDWDQISNLRHWEDPIVREYGITSIPNNYLLDQEGKVVAHNLKGDALRAKLDELLAQ